MKVIGFLSIAFVLLVSSHTEQNKKEQAVTKIEDLLSVSFHSVYYREQKPQSTELICEVDVLKPDLVLGISREGMITQLENDKGELVDVVDKALSGPAVMHYSYQSLSYRPQFIPRKKPPRWKTAIRSVLRLPPLKREVFPQTVFRLHPNRVRIPCDLRLLRPNSERINRVKGYFYVLMPESLEHIDVPFKPGKKWVRLTADLEIKVVEAQSTGSGYSYRIEKRRREGVNKDWFYAGCDLPDRLPAGRQFLGRGGNPINPLSEPARLPASVGGRGRESCGKTGPVKKIRFVIAVNPSHRKIPFELEDIPLPKR